MRKPFIAGNWKMNKTSAETKEILAELKPLVAEATCDMAICVPFTDLSAARKELRGSNIKLGAQNVHWAESGAFTGEISAAMLKEQRVDYVILGHSERRQYFGETSETVNKRAVAALGSRIRPIVCVGETLIERETGYRKLKGLQNARFRKDHHRLRARMGNRHGQNGYPRGGKRNHRLHPWRACNQIL